jgi:hypothetical protein
MKKEINEEELKLLKRAKALVLTEGVILDVLSGRAQITNIPENTTYVKSFIDQWSDTINIKILHSDFPEVNQGAEYEKIYAEVEMIDGQA